MQAPMFENMINQAFLANIHPPVPRKVKPRKRPRSRPPEEAIPSGITHPLAHPPILYQRSHKLAFLLRDPQCEILPSPETTQGRNRRRQLAPIYLADRQYSTHLLPGQKRDQPPTCLDQLPRTMCTALNTNLHWLPRILVACLSPYFIPFW